MRLLSAIMFAGRRHLRRGRKLTLVDVAVKWKFRCSTKVFVAFISFKFKSITNQNRKH